MSGGPDDDIAETLLEGDAYEQATVAVERMVPLSLAAKIRLAIASLVLSAAIAPAVLLRRDLVRSLEGTESLDLGIGLVALNGIFLAALGGLLLVRQQHIISRRSLTTQQARKLLRLEDLFALVVLLGGLFVLAPAVLALVGLVSPGTAELLADNGIRIYRPASTLGVDIRLVSGVGGATGVVLAGLRRLAG